MSTLPPWFLDRLRQVDAAANLSYTEGAPGHTETQFSYSGNAGSKTFTVSAGSFRALQNGMASLMFDLGFRSYGPGAHQQKNPVSLNYSVSATLAEWWMSVGLNYGKTYGSSWSGGYTADYNAHTLAFQKWQWMNGCSSDGSGQPYPSGWPTPAGARWGSFYINGLTKTFFDANPQYLYTIAPGRVTLNLSGSLTPTEYNTLVELIAARLLTDGFVSDDTGEWYRTNFDPEDTNIWDSDVVFPFAKRVVDRVRAGTNPVGGYGALTGIPTAQLGLYAYSQHREPPPPGDYTGLYVLVTLQFGTAGYGSYPKLVDAHKGRYDFIGVREFTDDTVATECRPLKNNQLRSTYLDRYDSFHNSGVRSVATQGAVNWGYNMVGVYALIIKCRTGSDTAFADALQMVVDDVYDGDPAVTALFEYMSVPTKKMHVWSLSDMADIIDDMVDGWYKTMFERLFVVWYGSETIPDKMSSAANPLEFKTASDPYWVKLPVLMAHAWALRNDDSFDSYSLVRRLTNARPLPEYPEFQYTYTGGYWGAGLRPDWWRLPYHSTHQEYLDAANEARSAAAREDDFDIVDDANLAVLHNVTPQAQGDDAPGFKIIGVGALKFIGPGVLTITTEVPVLDENDQPTGATEPDYEIITLAAGDPPLQVDQESGTAIYTHVGGLLFLDAFPLVRRDPYPGNVGTIKNWVYCPGRIAGQAVLRGSIRIFDATGQHDIGQDGAGAAGIGTGQLAVDDNNTSGTSFWSNIGRFLSLKQSKILAPRVFLEEDYPALSVVELG